MKRRYIITSIFILTMVALPQGITWGISKYAHPRVEKKHVPRVSEIFKVPEGLKKEVNFWRDIYSRYDKNQIVIHDTENLDIVYDVVDATDIDKSKHLSDEQKRVQRRERVDAAMEKTRAILLALDQNPDGEGLGEGGAKIKKMFENITGADKYKEAASSERLRSQTGQKDKFMDGIITSGLYYDEIESIFKREGLPKELTRLIFVESMFNTRALSKAGASGIWQFMPGTGKLYLTIDQFLDERNDPIKATYAAAALLKHNYDTLGSWPLAINAYNTGSVRIQQAVRAVGTKDIEKIIHNFKHPTYGFASRNFYCEFLAALDVYENYENYFGQLPIEKPLTYDMVSIPVMTTLKTIADLADADTASLIALNPGLRDNIVIGNLPLPAGYSIRVPAGKGPALVAALSNGSAEAILPMWHVVTKGETLNTIAKKYNLQPQTILSLNDIPGRRVKPNQLLRLR